MNEVEKLYENAGVKPTVRDSAIGRGYYIEHQRVEEYPPFTAEKQLQLILFILNTFKQGFNCRVEGGKISLDTLARGIAQEVINCWQDLTDTEKAQIKNILESEVRE